MCHEKAEKHKKERQIMKEVEAAIREERHKQQIRGQELDSKAQAIDEQEQILVRITMDVDADRRKLRSDEEAHGFEV